MTPEFYNILQRIRAGVTGDCEVSISTFGPEEIYFNIEWLVGDKVIRFRQHVAEVELLLPKQSTLQLIDYIVVKANRAYKENS